MVLTIPLKVHGYLCALADSRTSSSRGSTAVVKHESTNRPGPRLLGRRKIDRILEWISNQSVSLSLPNPVTSDAAAVKIRPGEQATKGSANPAFLPETRRNKPWRCTELTSRGIINYHPVGCTPSVGLECLLLKRLIGKSWHPLLCYCRSVFYPCSGFGCFIMVVRKTGTFQVSHPYPSDHHR